jgi:hypothetical protein
VTRRGNITDKVRRVVWVRSGGRCFICDTDLLVGDFADDSVYYLDELAGKAIGDLAHIVGAVDSPVSPRGKDDPEIEDRESFENLALACPNHNRQIDSDNGQEQFTVETLRRWKQQHEYSIGVATAAAAGDRTLPLRVLGNIEGGAVEARPNECIRAILAAEQRMPGWNDDRYDRATVDIDMRNIPGTGTAYYRIAASVIDEGVARLMAKHQAGHLERVSLFAAAKVPLLVYLGHTLDDVIATAVYQRHKVEQTWEWPADDTHPAFTVDTLTLTESTELLLLIGVTARPDVERLSEELRALPRLTLYADEPGDSVINSPAALEDFDRAVRGVYTTIDNSPVTRVHLVAAVPMSAAVILGRALPRSHHVPFSLYERTPEGYFDVLEVSA